MKKTVFQRVPIGAHPNELLAAWFARGMAITYTTYVVWAALTFSSSMPHVLESQGELWDWVFSLMTLLGSTIAVVGATFFPRTGRLEMFAGAGVIGLIAAYIILGLVGGWTARGAIILGSLLVMPIIRTVWIYRTLIRTAEKSS